MIALSISASRATLQCLAAMNASSTPAATDLIPTDGIVKETADKITASATSDLDKARRIYEWVVDNTFRNAKTRGCGIGDIASMLKTGNLSGKCADLNALFVGLARAAGTAGARRLRPARRAFEVRLQEPGRRLGGRHQGAALPRRSLSRRLRLGAGRSGRRAQGRAGGAAGKSCAQRCARSRPRARPCSAPGR